MTDLASLRIAEDRVEWGVECPAGAPTAGFPTRDQAEHFAAGCPRGHGPHRLVSRRVITTEWAEQC